MSRPLSHNDLKPCNRVIGSVINTASVSVSAKPPVGFTRRAAPFYIGNASSVCCVFLLRYVAKIAKPVIGWVPVDVVNNIRLLIPNKKPRKPVNVVPRIGNADHHVSTGVFASFATGYFSSVGVIVNDFTDRIRNNLCSHIAPPCGLVRGLRIAVLSTPILLLSAGCATQKGNDRHAQHAADQIRMVAVQREAAVQEAKADAQTNTALVEALAEVARTNPDHAPAVTVALAVIGVRGADQSESDTPVISLQQQRNEALEWTKALAPTVGGLVTGLGVAAINADVQKNASDNAAKVQINDAQSDVSIVEAVAGLGTAAANSVGIQADGDIYQVTDQGSIDQSVNTADSNNTTTTTTTTTTETSSVSLATTLSYQGQGMTLADLIKQLQAAGATYSIELDGVEVASGEGDGDEPVVIVCSGFSPQPAECN